MNDIVNDRSFPHLGSAEARLAALLARPKPIAIACVVILSALGWGACALFPSDPQTGWLGAICRPALGSTLNASDFALVLAMWAAMTLAMMLPTAGPMILTYAEIADTAAAKSEPVVTPIALTAGYLAVWLGFAAAAACLHKLLPSLTGAASFPAPLAGGIFLLAGFYQFTALKHACLSRCQRPFPFFFANWTTSAPGVVALGLRQGLYCLGCCWAMMLFMFAAGAMNVLWMAGLGILMTIEKMSAGRNFSRALGVAFLAVAALLLVLELG